MSRGLSFGQKVGAGFAVTTLLTIVIGAVSVYALRGVVAAKDNVIASNAQLMIDTERMSVVATERVSKLRGYLLDPTERRLTEIAEDRIRVLDEIRSIRDRVSTSDELQLLDAVAKAEAIYDTAGQAVLKLRQTETSFDPVIRAFQSELVPKRLAMGEAIEAFETKQEAMMRAATASATRMADSAMEIVGIATIVAILLAIAVALILTRTLGRQIGSAVTQVQSSSAELHAAANQQATSTKEQAAAMGEITTTITELLATSRQIAESAQRVASIAGQTATAARSGDTTVSRTRDSVVGIRRQVDLIVNHMLELGKKSQQIGAVLEIVSELAEQTNILAINATIEAAGAGDAGKRFAVVADEIRKLADRVAGSTKEIRGLIEDVRGAVNTTVMTTETGSKAVDSGAQQFADVTVAFKQIADLVGTTTEAAKEIELSTRQQATAVEQVNVAIMNVAQATKETEASSTQTLQTAGQLGALSRDLLRIVQPKAADGRSNA